MTKFLFFLCLSCSVFAQAVNHNGTYYREGIAHVEIGWMREVKAPVPIKAIVTNGRNYPVSQVAFPYRLAEWLQQSYMPTGTLGDLSVHVLAPPKSTWQKGSFRQQEDDSRAALPNRYGILAKMHINVAKTKTKQYWPTNGHHSVLKWEIVANDVDLISSRVMGLSGEDAYYCTMPRYTEGMKGPFSADYYLKYAQFETFSTHPALEDYTHYLRPDTRKYIILLHTEPLPFEQVKVGEFLDRLKERFAFLCALSGHSPDSEQGAKARRGLLHLEETFKQKREAMVYFPAPTVQEISVYELGNVEPGKDIVFFSTEPVHKVNGFPNYPLYKLKSDVKTRSQDRPKWVVCALDVPTDFKDAGTTHVMRHFVQNFNYPYLYQYAFGAAPKEAYRSR